MCDVYVYWMLGIFMLRKVQRLWMLLLPLLSRQAPFLMEKIAIDWFSNLNLLVLLILRHWQDTREGRQLVYHWLVRFLLTTYKSLNHFPVEYIELMVYFWCIWTPDKDAMFSGNFKFTTLLLPTSSPSPKKPARWTAMYICVLCEDW